MRVALSSEQIAVEYSPLFTIYPEEANRIIKQSYNPLNRILPDETIFGVIVRYKAKTFLEYFFENTELKESAYPGKYKEAYELVQKAKKMSFSEAEDVIRSLMEKGIGKEERVKTAVVKAFGGKLYSRKKNLYLISLIRRAEEKGIDIFRVFSSDVKISPVFTLDIISNTEIKSDHMLYFLLSYTNWEWYGKKVSPNLSVLIFKRLEEKFTPLPFLKGNFWELLKDVVRKLEGKFPVYFKELKSFLTYEETGFSDLFLAVLSAVSRDEELRETAVKRIKNKKVQRAVEKSNLCQFRKI